MQRLIDAWRTERNPRAELYHVQSEQGAALQRKYLHRRPLEGEVAIQTVWD